MMDVHVSAVVKGCIYQLRQLRSVQRSLTLDTRRAIVTAFIASRLDYCNALLYGVAKTEIQRLQTMMNAAAGLVSGLGRYDHITPVLRDTLHWLLVRQLQTCRSCFRLRSWYVPVLLPRRLHSSY